tara:strand:- start:88589 stop:89383 length:795 start_codon:yes stop_codon:yes gene_type:complete
MRRIIMLLTSLVIASSAMAAEKATPFDGFYVGASGGVNITQFDNLGYSTTGNRFVTTGTAHTPTSASAHNEKSFTNTGGVGLIDLGIGQTFDWFYLGAELYTSFGNRTTESVSASATAEGIHAQGTGTAALNSFNYGLDFKPGVVIGKNTLAYLRIGAAFANYTLSAASTSSNAATGQTYISTSGSHSNTVLGWRIGLGVEEMLTAHIGINFDYIYTMYNGNNATTFVTTNVNTEGTNTQNEVAGNTSLRFQDQQVLLGINYHF